jgi:hypothetical protein
LIASVGLSVLKRGIIDRGNIEIYTLCRPEDDTRGTIPWLADRGNDYSFGPVSKRGTHAEGREGFSAGGQHDSEGSEDH